MGYIIATIFFAGIIIASIAWGVSESNEKRRASAVQKSEKVKAIVISSKSEPGSNDYPEESIDSWEDGEGEDIGMGITNDSTIETAFMDEMTNGDDDLTKL